MNQRQWKAEQNAGMSVPLVSVIIAVYNSERYLRKTLDSVLHQTLTDLEVICVDDGSTDGSVGILEEYAARDQRVCILHQTETSDGAAAARNMGIAAARGKYISVLDADDFFEPQMLERAAFYAQDQEAETVIFDGYVHDDRTGTDKETGMILRKDFLPENRLLFSPEENTDTLFFMTMGAAWNVLFSADLIRREELRFQSFHHADDLGFVYLAFATAKRLAVLPERFVHYRVNNPGSQAQTKDRWPEAAYGALVQLKEALAKRGLFDRYRISFVQLALQYFELYLNDLKDAAVFENFYRDWREKYFEELEIISVSEKYFAVQRLAKLRNLVQELSPAEYLFRRLKKQPPFDRINQIIGRVARDSKVVVYGAGKLGRELFSSLLECDDLHVVAWVDRACESIGYPVVSPEELSGKDFDLVIVALEAKTIYDRIEAWLIENGVSQEKILWAGSGI